MTAPSAFPTESAPRLATALQGKAAATLAVLLLLASASAQAQESSPTDGNEAQRAPASTSSHLYDNVAKGVRQAASAVENIATTPAQLKNAATRTQAGLSNLVGHDADPDAQARRQRLSDANRSHVALSVAAHSLDDYLRGLGDRYSWLKLAPNEPSPDDDSNIAPTSPTPAPSAGGPNKSNSKPQLPPLRLDMR